MMEPMNIGASYGPAGCTFRVWAPEKEAVALHIVYPEEQSVDLEKDGYGYFSIALPDVQPGTRYFYSIDGTDTPDPASAFQPDGVHGPSAVIDQDAFAWTDSDWKGLPLPELILYELHTGTFTPEGTFEAIIPRLDELAALGVNAIELMPVSQFPGARNWGYDGVYHYAVQDSYGGPAGLKTLVDACHNRDIAVILDVVYNHLGPEGNYLSRFGPYFTQKYCTPWGDAMNLDDAWSDGVKDFIAGNVVHWLEHYHIDGLRLDAIHALFDNGARTLWNEIEEAVERLEARVGRKFHLIAESDSNSPRVVQPASQGGLGFSAQWLDDFHHALYVLLDRKGQDRYIDFGGMEQLAKAYTDGFVHSGEYVQFRKRKHGASSAGISGEHFIVFNQNHDQCGNRVGGERLSVLVDFERLKLAAAAVMLSPYIPMLFMGEEYGETAPFYYFVSHSEQPLIKAVREGRSKEFEAFIQDGEAFVDPQDEQTFGRSRLRWELRHTGLHALLLNWHKKLIALRRSEQPLRNLDKSGIRVQVLDERGLLIHRQTADGRQHLICLLNFSDEEITGTMPSHAARWEKLLDAQDAPWLPEGNTKTSMPDHMQAGEAFGLEPLNVVMYTGA